MAQFLFLYPAGIHQFPAEGFRILQIIILMIFLSGVEIFEGLHRDAGILPRLPGQLPQQFLCHFFLIFIPLLQENVLKKIISVLVIRNIR